MDIQERKFHWEQVYGTKAENEVSWFQETAAASLELISHPGVTRQSAIVDIGGGASRLTDDLSDRGYTNISVLDISAAALETVKNRLGARAQAIRWIEADITQWAPNERYDVWHDRAVLHFLTADEEREAYLGAMRRAVRPGGIIVIGSFDLDGPEKCSGLAVQRYSPETLATLLGRRFIPLDSRRQTHETPWGTEQKFQFSRFVRSDD